MPLEFAVNRRQLARGGGALARRSLVCGARLRAYAAALARSSSAPRSCYDSIRARCIVRPPNVGNTRRWSSGTAGSVTSVTRFAFTSA